MEDGTRIMMAQRQKSSVRAWSGDLIQSYRFLFQMDVDEKGTVAAAASYVGQPCSSRPRRISIDRSFVAIIILRRKGRIVPLFSAVVNRL